MGMTVEMVPGKVGGATGKVGGATVKWVELPDWEVDGNTSGKLATKQSPEQHVSQVRHDYMTSSPGTTLSRST